MKVLVDYASRQGATAGIAGRIAERLRAAGLEADAFPAASAPDPSAYDAAVVGSAAYMFHWLDEATSFVGHHREALAARPTWIFSSGPLGTATVDDKGRDVLETTIPREFAEVRAAIHPRGEAIFFGAYDPDQKPVGAWERLARMMPAFRDSTPVGDFRDWPAIEAWADGIADDLLGREGGADQPA